MLFSSGIVIKRRPKLRVGGDQPMAWTQAGLNKGREIFALAFVFFSVEIRKFNYFVRKGLIFFYNEFSNNFYHYRFKNACAFKNANKNFYLKFWVGGKIRT